MTKYRTATYIGLTPMTFLWGVTQVTDYLTRMHTAHLANVSKSVTKNATFPRTGGLPCLITHSCMSATSPTVVGGLIFCISATPHPGSLFPLFHASSKLFPLPRAPSCPAARMARCGCVRSAGQSSPATASTRSVASRG